MKTCTKCLIEKPLEEFAKEGRRLSGYSPRCKLCARAAANARNATPEGKAKRAASNQRNKGAIQARNQAYYQTNKEQLNESSRANYQTRKEHYQALNRKRWAENKERYKEDSKQWRVDNRETLLTGYKQRGVEHRAFLDELKANPCSDCGETYPPYCMEFDHVRGEKRFALGKMSNHSRIAVMEELAKCELVCCACHRVRTQERKGSSKIPKLIAFREWLDSIKSNPCLDCGRVRPAVAMDFDHIGEDKVTQISDMWSWPRDKVLAEIAKCELVCCICHRVRTQARRSEKRAA